MACKLHIENPGEALVCDLPITATCKTTGEIGTGVVKDVPRNLASAIALLGEQVVWERYMAQCGIIWKSTVRPKANGTAPKTERKRPKTVLEQLEEMRLAELSARKAAA